MVNHKNEMKNWKELEKENAFELVVAAGEIQLQSGAEISRVEETMNHMAEALQLDSLETFIIANGIFATAEGSEYMQRAGLKHISTGNMDLGKIEAVNTLSRHLEEGKLTREEAWEQLEEIKNRKDYSPVTQIVAYALGSGAFCYALGGSGMDALCAALVGTFLGIFFVFFRFFHTSKAIRTIFGSMLVTLLTTCFFKIGLGDSVNRIIIGVLIPMIPGVAFTCAIRDLVENDYLSGLIRLMDVLLTLGSIVAGVVFVWSLPGF